MRCGPWYVIREESCRRMKHNAQNVYFYTWENIIWYALLYCCTQANASVQNSVALIPFWEKKSVRNCWSFPTSSTSKKVRVTSASSRHHDDASWKPARHEFILRTQRTFNNRCYMSHLCLPSVHIPFLLAILLARSGTRRKALFTRQTNYCFEIWCTKKKWNDKFVDYAVLVAVSVLFTYKIRRHTYKMGRYNGCTRRMEEYRY